MADKMLNAFDVWITAQGVKSRTRLRSVENVSLEGIARLRELILDFAIRGKLVNQDPKDESADLLYEKMRSRQRKLVQAGKIRDQKKTLSHAEINPPFEIPKSWKWVYLSDIGQIVGGGTPDSSQSKFWAEDGFKWLTPADLYNLHGKYVSKGKRDLSAEGIRMSSATLMPQGAVLFSSRAPIGYVAIASAEISTNQGFKSCVPYVEGVSEYTYYFLKQAAKEIDANASGTTFKEISGAGMAKILFPLPPLAEQHRIVAKVDELMALCDELEQQETHHLKSHQLLVQTLLGTLTQAKDASDFEQAWNKLYEHFDDLFTTEDSIDQLKQTILQLAVMGKLVPQDPDDEPASELLKKIAKEKARLVAEGKNKTRKELSSRIIKGRHGDLPSGWVLTTLGQITQINPRNYADESLEASFIPMSMVGTSHSGKHDFEIRKWGDIKGGFTHFADGDIGIAKITPCFENSKAILLSDLKNGIGAGTTELFIARPFSRTVDQRYILLYLKSPEYLKLGESEMTGTAGQRRLSRTFFENNPLPLPPLNEQSRIVAKIDELFAVCDRLKERIAEAQKVANQMADSVVVN